MKVLRRLEVSLKKMKVLRRLEVSLKTIIDHTTYNSIKK